MNNPIPPEDAEAIKRQQDKLDKMAKEIAAAQIHMVEYTLMSWLEELLGRVAGEEEVMRLGFWANFSKTPLTIFNRGGVEFHRYFVWDKMEVVAVGFPDPNNPLNLKIVRVKREDWPAALCAYIAQYGNKGTNEKPS